MADDRTPAYTGTARFLHWLTAIAVLSMVPAGLAMLRIGPGGLQNFLFDYHRSVGVVLFAITAIRLLYRIVTPPVPLPDTIPALQRMAASATHTLLYTILLASPIIGWIGTSAYGAPIRVFSLFTLPPIVAKDKDMADLFLGAHEWLGWTMTALVCLHISAALYHQFVRRDGVLSRMLKGS